MAQRLTASDRLPWLTEVPRTPPPPAFTRALWARIQARTPLLMCQEALSQTSSSARLPRAAACALHHWRKVVVAAPTGRPSRKRSQTRPVAGNSTP